MKLASSSGGACSLAALPSPVDDIEFVAASFDSGAVEVYGVAAGSGQIIRTGVQLVVGDRALSITTTNYGPDTYAVVGDIAGRITVAQLVAALPGEPEPRKLIYQTAMQQVAGADISQPDLLGTGDGLTGAIAAYSLQQLVAPSRHYTSGDASEPLWTTRAGPSPVGAPITCVRWWPLSPSTLAAASAGGSITLFDTRAAPPANPSETLRSLPTMLSPRLGRRATGPRAGIASLAFAAGTDPWAVYGGTVEGDVCAWDVRAPGEPVALSGSGPSRAPHSGPTWAVAAAPLRYSASSSSGADAGGSPLIISGGDDGMVLAHASSLSIGAVSGLFTGGAATWRSGYGSATGVAASHHGMAPAQAPLVQLDSAIRALVVTPRGSVVAATQGGMIVARGLASASGSSRSDAVRSTASSAGNARRSTAAGAHSGSVLGPGLRLC